jgi:ubiquinone/menaquinone biosynthesis C-methylase UbiE
MPTKYLKVENYWTANPCTGGNPNLPYLFKGFSVLEIGCGGGADAVKFVESGASYTGIDLTEKAVSITKARIGEKGRVYQMNAESIDFPDNHFDMVYSWGVIHHALDQKKVYDEIYRVLKPRGTLYIMLYNKPSVRYNLDIMFLRQIAKWFHPRLRPYRNFAKKDWISANTDTLGCPRADVYTKKEALSFLYKYSRIKTFTTNWGWFRILCGQK